MRKVLLGLAPLCGSLQGNSVWGSVPQRRVLRYEGAPDSPHYEIVRSLSEPEFVLRGVIIRGDRWTHRPRADIPGAADEFGHGIFVANCGRATIEDVDVEDCWGDGIVLGFQHPRTAQPLGLARNVTIRRVTVRRARRNGLSIIGAENVLVEDSRFCDTHGTAPMAGCDLEPDSPHYPNRNITFRRCTFTNNGHHGLIADSGNHGSSWTWNVAAEDCTFSANRDGYALWFMGEGRNVFRRCRFYGPVVHLQNCVFIDCEFYNDGDSYSQSRFAVAVENDQPVEWIRCRFIGDTYIRGKNKQIR